MKNRKPLVTVLLIALPLLVVGTAAAASTFFQIRDDLARQQSAIAAQWVEVNAALEERAALMEQLAKGSLNDPTLLREVQEARAALLATAIPQARIRANSRLDTVYAKVLLQLHTHRGRFAGDTSHREELIRDADARVAVARRKYNEILEHFNARIQKFPQNLVARISGFVRNDAYFYTEPF